MWILYLLIAALTAYVAHRKNRNWGLWLLAGLLFSLVALIVVAVLPPVESTKDWAPMRKCPHCAEFVKREAKVCKHCHRDLPPEGQGVESTYDEASGTADGIPMYPKNFKG